MIKLVLAKEFRINMINNKIKRNRQKKDSKKIFNKILIKMINKKQ